MHDQCIFGNCMVSYSWWPQLKFLFLEQYTGNALLSLRSLLYPGTKTSFKAASNRDWMRGCLISWNIFERSHQIDVLIFCTVQSDYAMFHWNTPDSKVHGAHMGPTWVLLAPGGPHVGPMNLTIRVNFADIQVIYDDKVQIAPGRCGINLKVHSTE